MAKPETYNGWANYETWNVALWIGNDEGLYSMAREYRRSRQPYKDFVASLREYQPLELKKNGKGISFQTPDGVAWDDSGLDIESLNAMMEEL
jgi:hypothetical protein